MKTIIVTLCICFIAINEAFTQSTNKQSELQLVGFAGLKFLQPKYFNHSENISPAFVPTLGAGALWQKRKLLWGGEFSYTDGKKHTDENSNIYTGINLSFSSGYRWNVNKKFRLYLLSGFGYHLHHIMVTDNHYTDMSGLNTAVYHNMGYSVPLSMMVQRVNSRGTFIGMRIAYHFNITPNEWRYIENHHTEIYTTKSDGLFVQVVLGGLLQLNRQSL